MTAIKLQLVMKRAGCWYVCPQIAGVGPISARDPTLQALRSGAGRSVCWSLPRPFDISK
jgi:hypothetical protein